MASGPCLRRCRVVRRYIPIKVQFYRLSVKQYHFIHVSMYFEPLWEGNAVNTGVPCPKVPMHRKLGFDYDTTSTLVPYPIPDHRHALDTVGRSPTVPAPLSTLP